jgi:hypothetical protein
LYGCHSHPGINSKIDRSSPFACRSSGQAFHAHGSAAGKIIPLAVGEFDALDRAVATFEINGLRLRAASNHALHVELVGIAIGINDREAPHLYIVAPRCHSDRAETPFAPSNLNGVTVPPAEGDLLAAQLHPVLSSLTVTPLRRSFGYKNYSTHQRGHGRATEFEPHDSLLEDASSLLAMVNYGRIAPFPEETH